MCESAAFGPQLIGVAGYGMRNLDRAGCVYPYLDHISSV